MSSHYYIILGVKISKTLTVSKAVALPCLVEEESGLPNLSYFSLQGINSIGAKEKNKRMHVKYRVIKSKTEQDVVKHS